MKLDNKIILKRIIRAIKNLPDEFKIMSTWKYESCSNCGLCYSCYIDVKDDVWKNVVNNEDICLCPDCFIKLAAKKKIKLDNKDIKFKIFQPHL